MHSIVHKECAELLPWLVNGTLAAEDRQRLDAHLAGCAECRAEAAEQARLRDHILREDSVLYAPQNSLQKLLNRIDAEAEKSPGKPRDGKQLPAGRGVAGTRTGWPHVRSLAATFVAGAFAVGAAVSILSQAGGERQTVSSTDSTARYSTLTSGTAESLTIPAARVVFAPTTSVARLSELLRQHRARVVAGPTEAGVYTLTFDADPVSSNAAGTLPQVESAIVALRAEPDVLFAEPVLTHDTLR